MEQPLGSPLPRLGRRAAALASATLDLLLPPHCMACDQPVRAHGLLCVNCFGSISFITAPYCRRCGAPFAAAGQGGDAGLCLGCEASSPLFLRARAALRYDAGARRAILPFKHADRVELAALLAPHMARAGQALLVDAELLVPVPLHRRKLVQRRYNQAAVLARSLSRLSGRPSIPDILQRVRGTTPLGGKTAAERASELAGAFALRPRRAGTIAGRRILL
ncbi:MAG: ComF family protein, partial [Acetobacteraceae bacterium]